MTFLEFVIEGGSHLGTMARNDPAVMDAIKRMDGLFLDGLGKGGEESPMVRVSRDLLDNAKEFEKVAREAFKHATALEIKWHGRMIQALKRDPKGLGETQEYVVANESYQTAYRAVLYARDALVECSTHSTFHLVLHASIVQFIMLHGHDSIEQP